MKINLIPLAGRGLRFLNEGYKDPKPLIKINDKPMVINAANYLPTSNLTIFLTLNEHIKKHNIDKIIKKYIKKSKIIPIFKITNGQASTCLLAKDYIDENSQLTIGSCDNGMLYKKSKFIKIMSNPDTDAIIWTFRNNPNVLVNPKHWGWVELDKEGFVKKVSVKKPISDNPINDHAVVGCFSFKKAKFFFENAEKMIFLKRKINNEYYIDECMNLLIENKLKVKVFEIDKYIGWGTPNDLKTFLYWKSYFRNSNEKT